MDDAERLSVSGRAAAAGPSLRRRGYCAGCTACRRDGPSGLGDDSSALTPALSAARWSSTANRGPSSASCLRGSNGTLPICGFRPRSTAVTIRGRREAFRAFQAHLRPGVTAEGGGSATQRRRGASRRDVPTDYPQNYRFQVIPVIDWVVREFRGVLYTLFGAVSLLLVIACCNVANMLLARATTREREIAFARPSARAAAASFVNCSSRARCWRSADWLPALCWPMPGSQRWPDSCRGKASVGNPDQTRSAGSAVCAGGRRAGDRELWLFPAVQSARRDLVAGTNIAGRGTAGRRQTRMRSGLVVAQVALSIVLLLGAGLLMRTFVKLVGVDLGIDPKNLLVAARRVSTASEMPRRRISAVSIARPSSGLARSPAYVGCDLEWTHPLRRHVEPVGDPRDRGPAPGLGACAVLQRTPGRDGRPFSRQGSCICPGSTWSTRTTWRSSTRPWRRRYFGSEEPLGRDDPAARLATFAVPVADPTFEIIGVVRDFANQGPRERPSPQVLLPFTLRGPAGVRVRGAYVRRSDARGERGPSGDARRSIRRLL